MRRSLMTKRLSYREAAEKEDGYRLWLRYERVEEGALREAYLDLARSIFFSSGGAVALATREELERGFDGLLGADERRFSFSERDASLLVGTLGSSAAIAELVDPEAAARLGDEGFILGQCGKGGGSRIAVAAKGEAGLLYGVFRLLSLMQARRPIAEFEMVSAPSLPLRMLDMWDNLDRTVERGYAGFSIWDWHRLPDIRSPRCRDFARANASVGINAVCPVNVNADALVLAPDYLDKVAAIAAELRPYAIRVFLTARFSAPVELGGLADADPLSAAVAAWWKERVALIYERIPDFGGFLVKANSEGQPGPQDYGRTHADGANLLARALAPYGGKVLWRAFVYSAEVPEDRAKQAYDEFMPLDGAFDDNVIVQVKNGPIDFQPREPIHPLFGAMRKTPLCLELQATQEYLGCSTHLAYLGPLFSEALRTDTFRDGKGTTVAAVIDGRARKAGAVAAVANVGDDRDWCGHPFAAANWFSFGRLAWNCGADSSEIAGEWARLTFTADEGTTEAIVGMMAFSRAAVVDYMTPLGLVHIMARDHHYGPGPWVEGGRPDWTSVYFHRADAVGLGFDRSPSGSDAVSQYAGQLSALYGDPSACPEEYLLYFHHVKWDRRMASGRTLWDELCLRYQRGVDKVRGMERTWTTLADAIDPFRHARVAALLAVQAREAVWWKDSCLTYFQTFSRRPYPEGVEEPTHDLDYYRAIVSRYVPGLGRIR
jgi:alpha-glucuronidase